MNHKLVQHFAEKVEPVNQFTEWVQDKLVAKGEVLESV
jgi:hypothetical protein